MNRFSLRTRLVALAVVLVAFAVAATGAATYVALHTYLYGRLDDQVNDLAEHPTRLCAPTPGQGQNSDAPGGGAYASLISSTGTVASLRCAGSYQLVKSLGLSAGQARALLGIQEATEPSSLRDTGGDELRMVAEPQPDGSVLAVGLSTAEPEGTLGKLIGLELLIGAIAVVTTAVLGVLGVRLGMRPLDRVTRTARTVAAELGPDGRGLQNRVPDADPNTEVGQLAEAVNTMLGAVEHEYAARYESEQRLRRFLADASHELRTPLTSLRGYAELVRLRGGLDEEASDSLRRIETEGKRMGGLVDDLLTLARSDRGTVVERVPVDVAEVVDDAVAGLRAAYPGRQVEVLARDPLPVLGDRDQLLQVVTNILTNAAVHATAPVPIKVTASREGSGVIVRVSDGGPGLAPEQAAQVFDRFWRADAARTRVRGGSGLGLSIVQALVADHGGQVRFDSAVATGTTVTLLLPAAAPVPAARPAPALGPPAATPS